MILLVTLFNNLVHKPGKDVDIKPFWESSDEEGFANSDSSSGFTPDVGYMGGDFNDMRETLDDAIIRNRTAYEQANGLPHYDSLKTPDSVIEEIEYADAINNGMSDMVYTASAGESSRNPDLPIIMVPEYEGLYENLEKGAEGDMLDYSIANPDRIVKTIRFENIRDKNISDAIVNKPECGRIVPKDISRGNFIFDSIFEEEHDFNNIAADHVQSRGRRDIRQMTGAINAGRKFAAMIEGDRQYGERKVWWEDNPTLDDIMDKARLQKFA